MIEIKNITKKYPGQKIPALSGVNLKIESGCSAPTARVRRL